MLLLKVPREITVQGSVKNLDVYDCEMVWSSQVFVILCFLRMSGIEWDRSERRGCLSQSTSKLLVGKMLWYFVSQFERYIGMLNAEIQV